jgi:hypothetical protein
MTKLSELVEHFQHDHWSLKVSIYEYDWNNENVVKITDIDTMEIGYYDLIFVPIPIPKWLIRFIVIRDRMPKLLRFIPVWRI